MATFPGDPGFVGFTDAKNYASGAIEHPKLQSNDTTNKPTPNFLQADALPVY